MAENERKFPYLGEHVRHRRRELGLTLGELGARANKTGPYLSQLENGHIEPKLDTIATLAEALSCEVTDLLQTEAPNRRAYLEHEWARLQQTTQYEALGLPQQKPTSKLDDSVLEHLVGLGSSVENAGGGDRRRAGDRAREANLALRQEMRTINNYFVEIEKAVAATLKAIDYPGSGPLTERLVTDAIAHFGFEVQRSQGMPRSTRSITDREKKIIYIPLREDIRLRDARSVLFQTLGHFVLGHEEPPNFESYIRHRVESNYFAAAMLVPEEPAVELLARGYEDQDISIEDLKESFYVSYEMAAHRFTNLATEHLGLPVHFLRTDREGVISKAYENDEIPFPTDEHGSIEGLRVPRKWGSRQAFAVSNTFLLHHQHTTTDRGNFFCSSYIENATTKSASAITVGSSQEFAKYFRGSETTRRLDSTGEALQADPQLAEKYESAAWPSAAERSHVLAALPKASREYSVFPGVDLIEVYEFLDRKRRR
jgi:predicted transcriptional regulator